MGGQLCVLLHGHCMCWEISPASLLHLLSLRCTLPPLSLTRQQCRPERYRQLGKDRSHSARHRQTQGRCPQGTGISSNSIRCIITRSSCRIPIVHYLVNGLTRSPSDFHFIGGKRESVSIPFAVYPHQLSPRLCFAAQTPRHATTAVCCIGLTQLR